MSQHLAMLSVCAGAGFQLLFCLAPMRIPSVRGLASRIPLSADPPDVDSIQQMMKDPEELKRLEKVAEDMMKDPEKKRAMEDWQAVMIPAIMKMQEDPELKDVFDAMKKDGFSAFKNFENDERVMKKIASVQAEIQDQVLQEQAARELEDELIQEIFARFDVDKDGILNLAEFNALQVATEGPDAMYEQAQLESLILAVNPAVTEPSRGMPFADYRSLYVDKRLQAAYNTDVVRDHGKLFGSDHIREIPDEVFGNA